MAQKKVRESLSIGVAEKDRINILRCSGYIDSDNYMILSDAIDSLFDSGAYRIVVDLSDIDYISSAGWGIFLGNLKRAAVNGGDIRLAGMHENVREIYDLLNLENLVAAYNTAEEAVRFD